MGNLHPDVTTFASNLSTDLIEITSVPAEVSLIHRVTGHLPPPSRHPVGSIPRLVA